MPKGTPEMAAIPDKYLDLLQRKKAFASLATLMPDGSPQVTPVWIDYADGVIRFNTAKGRVKARNLKVGSPVALAIMDPDEPYRYLQVRGRVRRVTEEGADAHIDSARKSIRSANPAKSASCTKSSRNPPPEWAEAAGSALHQQRRQRIRI